MIHPRVEYDDLASTYDLRYERSEYEGVEHVVAEFLASTHCERVLEVGCGTGHWLRVLGRHGVRPFGLDLSHRMLQQARRGRGAHLCRGTASELPYRDRSFDEVVCINALHHFAAHGRFVTEACRTLAAGGGLLIVGLDPHTGKDRWCVYDYFEGTLESDLARYPATGRIQEIMRANGLQRCVTREAIHFDRRFVAGEALARGWLAQTTNSQLASLGAEEYLRGIDRIRAAERPDEKLELIVDVRLWATVGWLDEPP